MPALVQLTDGIAVPAAQVNALFPIYAFRSADSAPVNNSIALVNDSSLFWPLAANASYDYRITILYNSNATANLRAAFTFPAGCRMDPGSIGLLVGGAGTVSILGFPNYASGFPISVAGIGASDAALHIFGKIDVGVTPGNLQFQFAQNTANVSNTIVRAGSSGTLRQSA